MEGFPLLPGYRFTDDITRTNFRLRHTFDFVNGYRIPLLTTTGQPIGSMAEETIRYKEPLQPVRFDPSLTYGRTQTYPYPQFIPMFALYRGKCLCFKAFFKQSVFESPDETYRVRKVNIIYFLEDDTISVHEPAVRDAGFQQGMLVRRSKIRKDNLGNTYHWKDFNLGLDVAINCIVYHIVDADNFTKEYLESQGIELNREEEMPEDPYTLLRNYRTPVTHRKADMPDDKLRRLLEYDKKVLRFYALMDEGDRSHERRVAAIHYYLQDDTIEVVEKSQMNDGRDPFPTLLRRIKCPKNWKDIPDTHIPIFRELAEDDVEEYYTPKDFKIGETVFIYARRYLIYDCDAFTRNFYRDCFNIDVGEPIHSLMDKQEIKEPQEAVPPYTVFGSMEDSLQSHYKVIPKPAKKDFIRLFTNEGKRLNYTAYLDEIPEEGKKPKEFIISYHLSNGEISLTELSSSGSSRGAKRFLRPTLIRKPDQDPYAEDPELYTPADIYIGARLVFFSRRFIVTGASLQVYRYMQGNPEKFPPSVVDNIRNYCVANGYLHEEIADETKTIVKEQTKECLDIAECCKDAEPPSMSTAICAVRQGRKSPLPSERKAENA